MRLAQESTLCIARVGALVLALSSLVAFNFRLLGPTPKEYEKSANGSAIEYDVKRAYVLYQKASWTLPSPRP